MTTATRETPAQVAWADLTDIPELYADLGHFAERRSKPGSGGGKACHPSRPLIDLEVLTLQQDTPPTLSSWARLVHEQLTVEGVGHTAPPAGLTVPDACGFLRGHLVWIFEHRWSDELAAAVSSLARRLRLATGWTPPPTVRCPSCDWYLEPQDGGTWYACIDCKRTWVMSNEIGRLIAEQASSLSLRECADDLGRPVKTLHYWRSRGWLPQPVGKDHRGRLYDIRRIREVAEMIEPRVKVPPM